MTAMDISAIPHRSSRVAQGGRVIIERLSAIETMPPLSAGAHTGIEQGACVMELISWVAGEPWSDHPSCVCPIIGAFLRVWNDGLPDDERDALLRPLIPLVLNTRSTPGVERRRALMAADWLVREHTPAWLRLARLDAHADALSGLPEITDMAQCPSLMPVLEAARKDAAAAWGATGAAAAARAAAAAAAAAADAAWEAAQEAGVQAARAAAAAAAAAAARAAADTAAAAAAWEAARETGVQAARAAAAAAAWAALQPTRLALQQSALVLMHRMIAVTGDAA